MAEAQNSKKYWKILYTFILGLAIYSGIAGTVNHVESGEIALAVASVITAIMAFVFTIKLF